MPFLVGLDLGQAADYTALAVVHSVHTQTPDGQASKGLQLRHLERYPLRTPYPEIVEKVAALVRDEKLSPTEYDPSRGRYSSQPPALVVDNTGVGVAVTDLLKGKGLRFTPVTITGGDTAHKASGNWRVSKRDAKRLGGYVQIAGNLRHRIALLGGVDQPDGFILELRRVELASLAHLRPLSQNLIA